MTTRRALPKSTAKTAYGLLSEIRALILAEPARYDQCNTLARGDKAKELYEQVPACGTVGCVAGWTVALRDPDGHRDVCSTAAAILGLDDAQYFELFSAEAAGNTLPQSRAHAKKGAALIARFQKKYGKQLKATKVSPCP